MMMTATTLVRQAVFAACVTIAAVTVWECYLRHEGVTITYDDSADLWADKRARVYDSPQKATVFIGSSRIKYDLNIKEWQRQTGKEAVQLAIEGTSPVSILQDLADDPDFNGNLVVDVTEVLYYSSAPDFNTEPKEFIRHYHDRTYAQKAGFQINRLLESQFVFLNEKFFSLQAALGNIPLQDRAGIKPKLKFPMDFMNPDFDRQTWMNSRFLSDTGKIKQVTNLWSGLFTMIRNSPPPTENPVPGIVKLSLEAVNKIRSRGGDVVFVRTPSSGPFFEFEQQIFTRDAFWEPLLTGTNSKGFHFKDYPAISMIQCPEWSHLSPQQTHVFTTELIRILPSSFTR